LVDHILLNRDDVLFTSHNAFNTIEALEQIIQTTVSNIKAFLESRQENIVTAL